jgi:RNA polymerase sigma factor (sigma-70 family)
LERIAGGVQERTILASVTQKLHTNTMKVNEAYQQYIADPTPKNYDELGKALSTWIPAIAAGVFGSRYNLLQDAVGNAMYNVLANLTSFDPTKNSFHMWVYAITYNACMDKLRQDADLRHRGVELQLERDNPVYQPIDKLFLKQLKAQLSEKERTLLEFKMDGFTFERIAQELNSTENAVECRWRRLQQKLRTLSGGG